MDFLPILIIVSLLAIGQIVMAVYLVRTEKRSLSLPKEEKPGLEHIYEDQLRVSMGRMEKEFGNFLAVKDKQLTAMVEDGYLTFIKRLEEKLVVEEDKIQKQMEEYKKTRMARVDEQMVAVFDQVTKKVLGKVLSSSQKMDLIVEALEEAKKDKLWN